jgi:hypothetical protein
MQDRGGGGAAVFIFDFHIYKKEKKMSPKSSAQPSIRSATAIAVDARCKYVASSGRRCRTQAARDTSRASGFSAFCLPHAQMEQQYLNSESVAEELIGNLDDFRTSHAINEILGKLFILVAQNRIPLRNASTLSYICQLLLSSTPGVRGELHLKSKGEELFVLNRTTDLMWGKDNEDEDDDQKKGENESDKDEQQEVEQKAQPERNEQKPTNPSVLDAAMKPLASR